MNGDWHKKTELQQTKRKNGARWCKTRTNGFGRLDKFGWSIDAPTVAMDAAMTLVTGSRPAGFAAESITFT